MRELADRLQQAVARTAALMLEHDQRLVDERGNQIEDIVGLDRIRAADRLRRR